MNKPNEPDIDSKLETQTWSSSRLQISNFDIQNVTLLDWEAEMEKKRLFVFIN